MGPEYSHIIGIYELKIKHIRRIRHIIIIY